MEALTVLEALLRADGFEVDIESPEASMPCFAPGHEDSGKSMRVDWSRGRYQCLVCNAAGDAYTYMRDILRLTAEQAAQRLSEEFKWTEARLRRAELGYAEVEHKRDKRIIGNLPDWEREPPPQVRSYEKVSEHLYHREDGEVVMRVVRYQKRDKKIWRDRREAFTPARADGGVWCAPPLAGGIPKADRMIDKFPLYRLADVRNAPDQPVWVADNEWTADLARGLKGRKGGAPVATCVHGDGTEFGEHDLQPLFGRVVVIFAVTTSKKRSEALARWLQSTASNVLVVCTPDGSYGLLDAIRDAEGEFEGVARWIRSMLDRTAPRAPAEQTIEDNIHFTVLGIRGPSVLFRRKLTQELVAIPRRFLANEGNLTWLADLDWWQEQIGEEEFSAHKTRLRLAATTARNTATT